MTIRAALASAALALACLVTGAGSAAADDWYNHTVDTMPIQKCVGSDCGFPTAD
ncbi:hypothetical protein ACFU76_13470 [Streptomyces sp. NPDC057539]|uniref:hypothetical protein n=1 Tax=Streptomyces sp. NPDC057539 TaxID=3346159 RepID=UPI0036C516F7